VFMQVSDQAQFYISRDLVRPLDSVLETIRSAEGGIYEGTLPQGLKDGEHYALPVEISLSPMYVRTDLLEQVGMGLPETFEELREASQKIVEADPQIAAFGLPTSNANDAEGALRRIVWSWGGAMFAEDGETITWDSPETVEAYRFIKEMFDEGTIPRSTLTWDDGGNNTAYQTGRTAFTMNPPSIYQWMVENDQELLENTALIATPSGPGEAGQKASSVGSFMWMVSASTDMPEEAEAWLTYFYEPDRYRELIDAVGGRWVPIYPALTRSMPLFTETPAFANFDEMASTGIVDGYKGPPSALSAEIATAKIVSNSVQRMLVDGESPEDAVAWAQAEMEKLAAAQ
jgi:multiple sugar transport system substrate-binding protein